MRTKHLIISLIAFMAIFLASCSEEQTGTETAVNGTQTFTFHLTTDGQTQTRATTAPVVSGYKLKYFLQVLDDAGSTIALSSQNNETGTFDVELPVGTAYTCLFWAHYVPDTGSGDNEFFTATDLKAVTLQKHLTSADQCQAFCATAAITISQGGSSQSVVLKRAVAQVNVKSNEQMTGYTKLTAKYTAVPNTFNVQTSEVGTSGSVTTPSGFEVTDFSASSGTDGKFTYQSAYFLASSDGVGSMLGLEINTYNSANPSTPLQTMTVANVPTKKNYKTNIVTSFDPANVTHTYACSFEEWGTDVVIKTASKWNGVIPSPDAGYTFGDAAKDGTSEANAYVISNATDLAQLTANVNAGTSYDGKYFKQDIDIDMSGTNYNWTPIGTDTNPFKANYDGNRHRIINLKVNITGSNAWAGFFGYAEGNIVIKNIHVSGDVSGGYVTGGVCGSMSKYQGTTSGKISGCSFRGSAKGSYSGGGICGTAGNNTIITACANYGIVTCNYQGGGIVGLMENGSIAAGCYNTGVVNPGDASATSGGISGQSGSAVGCYNTGVIGGAYINSTTYSSIDCFTTVEYGNSNGTTVFGSSAWPAYASSSSSWYVDATPDGSYTNSDTAFSNCKFWKSGGDYNGGTPVYPKLWWEE